MTQQVNVPGVGALNFPDGMSQAEMAAAIQKNFPQIHAGQPTQQSEGFSAAELGLDPKMYGPNWRGFPPTGEVGPPLPAFSSQRIADTISAKYGQYQQPEDITRGAMQQVAANVEAGDLQIPAMQRNSFQEKLKVPLAATAASLAVPGSGWGALALQSLMAGGGATAGELFRQQDTRDPTDVRKALKTGAAMGASNLAAGAILKTLGAASKAIFSSPLDEPQQQAARFARSEGAPFPLSSAAPGSPAGNVQQGSRMFLSGDIKTQLDANKVTSYLNSTVGRMTEKAQVFDDAAKQGQQFLREVFEPGETVVKGTFAKYTQAVGDDALIPTTNTLGAAKQAADFLERRGQTTGGLYQRLRTILKKAPGTYTPREFDELYGSVIKQAFTSKAAAGGEGRILLEGITKDMDEFGRIAGVSFADDIAKAAATREQFRELRNIPQLQRLASEMGDKGGTKGTIDWMNSLFSTGNGKALAKMRELNPELYHDLADAYLARQIDNAADFSGGGILPQVNGVKLRTWFEQNQGKIKEIYGAPQAEALDNFTVYAKYMTGAVERSAKGKTFDPMNLYPRLAAEVGSAAYKPGIVLGGESGAFVLARGLADPNSALFRAFTQGFSPATRSFAIKAGGLAAQQGGLQAVDPLEKWLDKKWPRGGKEKR